MTYKDIVKPSKDEQQIALQSYETLTVVLRQVQSQNPEIEIDKIKEKIRLPISALKLLADILKELSNGNPVSILPVATELTTQAAAEYLSCSRPHVVKLLEEGEIPYTKVGTHRRVKFEDVLLYKQKMKENQRNTIRKVMDLDEESGLYDL